MKKKIIFMIINMNVGGTEKALLNMISEMPKDKFDISILLLEEYGDFQDSIPDYVHVEYLQGYNQIKDIINQPLHLTVIKLLKSGMWIKAINFMCLLFYTKIIGEKSPFIKYVLKDFPSFKTEYDIAVAYAGPMELISYYVINKIKSKQKVQWIHFDVTKIGFNKSFATKIYKKFDRIFVVSYEAKIKLINLLPEISKKVEVFFNIVPSDLIKEYAKRGSGFKDDFDGLRILTIGRLSKEKGQDIAIRAFSQLINDGYNIRWYCLGEGNSRKEYEKLIIENKLEDKFILLGSDTNPYPYLEQCDIYVQPSRYEGYCITLIEAKQFFKPIVTTNVNGANEQISNGKTGLIVNIDENEIYLALKKLIENKFLRSNFSSTLAKENYGTSREMNKLFNILEG
ncbi:glycosyltransferase [Bacillus sp. EB600]|uniref:glycosyltransferase n=1 Tax=Bacillus sp. EB600 TaxID=2806345 RepID=UPI00210AD96C|nr:glycosyltransferase [Bacillus sp. EB600]MCQ6278885.1 glycosyltransferase [Bacillus sp. EB600]